MDIYIFLDSEAMITHLFFEKFIEIFKLNENHPHEKTIVTVENEIITFKTESGAEYKTCT